MRSEFLVLLSDQTVTYVSSNLKKKLEIDKVFAKRYEMQIYFKNRYSQYGAPFHQASFS